jgi:hypothetical protein
MYRITAITVRSGYHRMYGEATNLRRKPLYLVHTSLKRVMAWRGRGETRVGYRVPPGRHELVRA